MSVVSVSAQRRSRVVYALLDQGVVAAGNAGNGLLAAILLSREAAGSALIAIATLYFVMGVGRAFIGDAVLAHVSRFDGAERRRRENDALGAALVVGVVAAVPLGALWFLGPKEWFRDLIWAIPLVPALLLQDTGRFTHLAAREQRDAFRIDIAWVAIQALMVALVWLLGWRTAGALLLSWGIGAAGGTTLYLLRTRLNPLEGRIGAWFRETRHLTNWFTGSAIIGQSQVLLVALIVAEFLSEAAYAGLRLTQLVVLQPIQNLISALNGLLVPRFSRLAHASDFQGVRRLTARMALLGVAVGAVVTLLASLLAEPAAQWFRDGQYRNVAPIAVPVSLQAALYLVQLPFAASLRGMQLARLLFVQYAVFSSASLVGVVVGASQGGLLGAAWGLALGASVGFVTMVAIYLFAIGRHARAG